MTAKKCFWDTAERIASDQAWSMLSDAEIAARPKIRLEVCERSPTGKALSYTIAARSDPPYERFEGRTLAEETQRLEGEICRSGELMTFEEFSVDRGFEGAIGLHAVVDAPSLTRDVVSGLIERFLALGEVSWRAEQPVPRNRLPETTYEQALRSGEEEESTSRALTARR
ncbi:hypothetical protein [Hydrocarboniphaga sp.]|uniref:hypothetical protein n=1 Tax=Hydrocarboniphaga sp. TaxID=2033016 RepID=UPI002623A8EB|nr:hypothetical protein [Hydrocarboniphaga sp.]